MYPFERAEPVMPVCPRCGQEANDFYKASGTDEILGCEDCVSLICAHEYMEEHGENLRCLAGDMRFEEARELYG